MKKTAFYLILVLCSIGAIPAIGQRAPSADSLFRQARGQAFDRNDYPAAIAICRFALQHFPTDPDLGVFLGRLYAWTNQPDSARQAFARVLEVHPGSEDALVAWADMESWNGHYDQAIALCEEGLKANPGSIELHRRRDRFLAGLRSGRVDSAGNKVGLSYDYIYFDRQYVDPWHLVSLEYSRQTRAGSIIGWVNYANRFRNSGAQFEVEVYPHISKAFYGYLEFGYSPNSSIFPAWRGGASLYVNLPHAMEADAGFRYLYFNNPTVLYTFSLGKYYNNYWINARCWLVPGQAGTSQSITVTARYYTGGADDYLSIAAGTGLSPDDNTNNVQLAGTYRLSTQKLRGGWRHAFHRHIAFAGVEWLYQEYLPETHGHQWDIGAGYLYRF